jgi:hypothetical protein
MKKVMSLVLAISVTLSLSACRAGTGNGNNNANNGGIGTNQGNTVGLENTGYNNNVNYKDGTYTGQSDGGERATVVVSGGRIVNIDLTRTGDQGGNNTGNAAGNNLGGTAPYETGNLARNNPVGTAPYDTGNMVGNNTGNAAGMQTGTEGGGVTGIGAGDATGGTNNNTAAGTGIGGVAGNAAGTAVDAVNTARTRLITAMIQNQSSNVNIDNNDATAINSINNWKQAVSRALDQARQ